MMLLMIFQSHLTRHIIAKHPPKSINKKSKTGTKRKQPFPTTSSLPTSFDGDDDEDDFKPTGHKQSK